MTLGPHRLVRVLRSFTFRGGMYAKQYGSSRRRIGRFQSKLPQSRQRDRHEGRLCGGGGDLHSGGHRYLRVFVLPRDPGDRRDRLGRISVRRSLADQRRLLRHRVAGRRHLLFNGRRADRRRSHRPFDGHVYGILLPPLAVQGLEAAHQYLSGHPLHRLRLFRDAGDRPDLEGSRRRRGL